MEPFIVSVDERGTVEMRLVGSLDDSNLEVLRAQVANAKKLVKEEFEKQGKKVKILFDLSEFTGTYNVPAMLEFKTLEEHNRPYVDKTAVFGGPAAAKVAAELTLALIHRDNLQLFDSQEEADTWLQG